LRLKKSDYVVCKKTKKKQVQYENCLDCEFYLDETCKPE
jgi:hypothetical protein